MKTLYKNTRLIAAAILGTLVLSAGAAVAVTRDSSDGAMSPPAASEVDDLGRFVVTPKSATYVLPADDLGRFVVSQHGAVFVPAA